MRWIHRTNDIVTCAFDDSAVSESRGLQSGRHPQYTWRVCNDNLHATPLRSQGCCRGCRTDFDKKNIVLRKQKTKGDRPWSDFITVRLKTTVVRTRSLLSIYLKSYIFSDYEYFEYERIYTGEQLVRLEAIFKDRCLISVTVRAAREAVIPKSSNKARGRRVFGPTQFSRFFPIGFFRRRFSPQKNPHPINEPEKAIDGTTDGTLLLKRQAP